MLQTQDRTGPRSDSEQKDRFAGKPPEERGAPKELTQAEGTRTEEGKGIQPEEKESQNQTKNTFL